MKKFFYREITKPDLVMRNQILCKLHMIKKFRDKYTAELRGELRRMLLCTYGKTDYFKWYKGMRIWIGDDTTKKKLFMSSISSDSFINLLKSHRKIQKQKNTVSKRLFRPDKGIDFSYSLEGGVNVQPATILVQSKNIKRKRVFNPKKPTTEDSYIGIEIEYASKHDLNAVADFLAEERLQDCVRVVRDGSIEISAEYPYQLEFCILTKFSELATTVEKLKKIITPDRFQTNSSCGLHVHLDARNKDVHKMYANLACMQNLLFELVDESRRDNTYCVPVTTDNFEEADGDNHYDAISKSAYYKHGTIEVRIHNSTLNLTNVEKWIRLLERIAYYSGPEVFSFGVLDKEIEQVKHIIKSDEYLTNYLREKGLT